MDKIKNAVTPGIHTCNQIRPRYWTLGRNTCRKLTERSLLYQRGEIRHPAFLDESLEQLRVHAVDAEHDDFFVPAPTGPLTRDH